MFKECKHDYFLSPKSGISGKHLILEINSNLGRCFLIAHCGKKKISDKTVFILLIKFLFKNLNLQRFSEIKKKVSNSYEKADSSTSFSFKDNLSQHIAFRMLLNHTSFAYASLHLAK